MRKLAVLIFASCMASSSAFATVIEKTTYRPFLVHGKTAREIYQSVITHSRKKDGYHTFATTDVSLKPKIKLVTKPQCKVTQASITARFIVNLPKLANEAALAPDLRRDWQSFAQQLKHHEEHHRDIWLGCAADIASAATSLAADDCTRFATKFEAHIKQAQQSCSDKNVAFDDEAQRHVSDIPFIERALQNR